MEKVRRLRQEKGWNQTELAFYAGLAPSVISQIETGKRSPGATSLRKLADALGVEIPDLFERTEAPKAQAPLPFNGWAAAVDEARRVREDGRERLDELMEAWRERKDASGGGSAALLGRIGGLLQEAHEAEKALRSAGADGRPGAPATDEFISELQEASRFYGELRGRIEGAGLRVRRGDQVEDLAA